MTLREAYEATLVELNKVQAPSLLLDDFNYLFNKAIQKYFNKRYSLFEVNQQLTDDLRVLVKTVALTTTSQNDTGQDSYTFNLPNDYVHILNCICEFKFDKTTCNCQDCNLFKIGANKLTTNQWSQVITNYYMRPSIKQPYYYIQNLSTLSAVGNTTTRQEGNRYGNRSVPTLEIKCGTLDPSEHLSAIYIDYLQAPEYLELTENELDKLQDSSHELEFPDYVIYEIINEMVLSILENSSNPRTQTYVAVNSTVPQKIQ